MRGMGSAADGRSRTRGVVDRRAQHFPYPHRCAHRSEEHTSELQSLRHLVCRLLLEKKKPHLTEELLSLLGFGAGKNEFLDLVPRDQPVALHDPNQPKDIVRAGAYSTRVDEGTTRKA